MAHEVGSGGSPQSLNGFCMEIANAHFAWFGTMYSKNVPISWVPGTSTIRREPDARTLPDARELAAHPRAGRDQILEKRTRQRIAHARAFDGAILDGQKIDTR
jgi:hypothetical protein